MVFRIALLFLSSFVFAGEAWGPTDCAFSVWGEWTTHPSGSFQTRTRHVIRQARQGGRPCEGELIQYRSGPSPPDPGFEALLSLFLRGNAPSYSLGNGRFYTLSRDFVVLLDSTIEAELFPYAKSMVSNLIGKVCGDFGSEASDNRLTMASFDSSETVIHRFGDTQAREVIQDKALLIPRSGHTSYSNIIPAADFATATLHSDISGTRRYNNATKEVLMVTSYTDYCSRRLHTALNRLRTAAELYIIVIGRGTSQQHPDTSCLETLATSPTESHFRQFEDITAISQVSGTLLDQSPINHFCTQDTPGQQY